MAWIVFAGEDGASQERRRDLENRKASSGGSKSHRLSWTSLGAPGLQSFGKPMVGGDLRSWEDLRLEYATRLVVCVRAAMVGILCHGGEFTEAAPVMEWHITRKMANLFHSQRLDHDQTLWASSFRFGFPEVLTLMPRSGFNDLLPDVHWFHARVDDVIDLRHQSRRFDTSSEPH
jgi:hypothetical protein